jgi:hypothetical protein
MAKSNDSDAPKERWDVLAPHDFEHNGEQRTGWTRLGAAFPIKDGGFTLKLRAFPVAQGNGEATIVLKKRNPNEKPPEDWDLP